MPILLFILIILPSIASATWYYVTPTGSGSSCGVPDGNAAPPSPCSLSTGLNLAQAGDTIILRNGTYTGNFQTVRGGGITSRLTIRAENQWAATIASPSSTNSILMDIRHSYVTLSDVDFSGNGTNHLQQAAVRIRAVTPDTSIITSVVVEKNRIRNAGSAGMIVQSADNFIIRDNQITGTGFYSVGQGDKSISGEGILLSKPGGGWPATNGEIYNNDLTNINGECFDLFQDTDDMDIHHNLCEAQNDDGSNDPQDITGFLAVIGASNIHFHDNIVRNGDNTSDDTYEAMILFDAGSADVTVDKNTFYNLTSNKVVSALSCCSTNIQIINNSFCNLNTYQTGTLADETSEGFTYAGNQGYTPDTACGADQAVCDAEASRIEAFESLVGIDETNYGRTLEVCVTTAQGSTNGVVIVPDGIADLETAVEGQTNKTILVKSGLYTVDNLVVGANNMVLPYNCEKSTITVSTSSNNTVTTDGWTIGGMEFDCGELDRACFRLCDANNVTIRNSNFRNVRRDSVHVACDSDNTSITGNIFEGCKTCSQGSVVTVGDILDPGGVGCSGAPCRYGESPSNTTVNANHFRANVSTNQAAGGAGSMLAIEGYSRLGLSVTNNLFDSIRQFSSAVVFSENWLRSGNALNGSANVGYNTIIGPFNGVNFTTPSSPAFEFKDSTACNPDNDCPLHRVHHNYASNSYSASPSTGNLNTATIVTGDVSRYSSVNFRHNIDHNARTYNDIATEAIIGWDVTHNTFFSSGIRFQNEACTNPGVQSPTLTFEDNLLMSTTLTDGCFSPADWEVNNNVFSGITGGFNGVNIGTGNSTSSVTVASTSYQTPDFTVITAGQSQIGAIPAPVLSSATINDSCELSLDMTPYDDGTYDHGNISNFEFSKATVKYDDISQTISGSSITGNTIKLVMSTCPASDAVVTFSGTYGWCRDNANVGGAPLGMDARCLAVTDFAVSNTTTGSGPEGTFYVDSTCTEQGDGTSRTCGPNGPWTTLKYALETAACAGMEAGDILEIQGNSSYSNSGDWLLAGQRFYGEAIVPALACSDIIIQNGSGQHVVFDGTIDLKGQTWTSLGNGVYECTSSTCGTAAKFPFTAWTKVGSNAEERLNLIQTVRTCSSNLAAGTMTYNPSTNRVCARLSSGVSPASTTYFRIPYYDIGLNWFPNEADNVTIRKNPNGTGSFLVTRFRDQGILSSPNRNTGMVIDGIECAWIMDLCLAVDGLSNVSHSKVNNTIVHDVGQRGIHFEDDLGQYEINNNTIYNIGLPPAFEQCNGVGAGCLTGYDKHAVGIYLNNCATEDSVEHGSIRNNTIANIGNGYSGFAYGVQLDECTYYNVIDANVITDGNSSGNFTAIALTGTIFSGSYHAENVITNNRMTNVDWAFGVDTNDSGASQAGKTQYVLGNTCHNPNYGCYWQGKGAGLGGSLHFRNNIASIDDAYVKLINVPSSSMWNANFTHNAFECDNAACSGQTIATIQGTNYRRNGDCTSDCISNLGNGNLYGALDVQPGNLSIQVSSAAFDAGVDIPAKLPRDAFGRLRPGGAVTDIGAYEVPQTLINISQDGFRIYDGFQNEKQNPMAAENVDVSMHRSAGFTVRFSVIGATDTTTLYVTPYVQLCNPSCGSWVEVTDVCSGNAACIVNHPRRSFEAKLSSSDLTLDSRTFSTDSRFIDAYMYNGRTFGSNEQLEMEYSLKVGSAATAGDVINLRLQDDFAQFGAYTETPSITLDEPHIEISGGLYK